MVTRVCRRWEGVYTILRFWIRSVNNIGLYWIFLILRLNWSCRSRHFRKEMPCSRCSNHVYNSFVSYRAYIRPIIQFGWPYSSASIVVVPPLVTRSATVTHDSINRNPTVTHDSVSPHCVCASGCEAHADGSDGAGADGGWRLIRSKNKNCSLQHWTVACSARGYRGATVGGFYHRFLQLILHMHSLQRIYGAVPGSNPAVMNTFLLQKHKST